MKIDGQNFLEELARLPGDTFESHFSEVAVKLGLGTLWERNELKLLYEAAWCACLCNLALNGWDTGGGDIRRELEGQRRKLEREFMIARDIFRASPGWQNFPDPEREIIEGRFLRVFVAEDKLAW